MPEYLVAIPVVAGVIKALENEPFDPERFEAARVEATVAAVARGQATSNETWAVAWAAWAAYESAAAKAAAKAAAVAARTWMAAAAEGEEAAEVAAAWAEDILRQQLAVIKEALTEYLKTLEN
jgi:hypothetical protein